jgi:hypothetical protein
MLAMVPFYKSSSAGLVKPDKEAIPVLVALFGSDDVKVRRFAAYHLDHFGEPKLSPVAESWNESIRQAAIAAWKPRDESTDPP